MKLRILTVALFLTSMFATGQTKVGSIDSDLIVGLMPETKKVLSMLNSYAKRLDSSYQIKLDEYKAKVESFQKLGKEISDNFKKIKVEELAEMEKKLQLTQQNGSKLVQLKRDELMRPLYKKLRGVISEVAKAEGYTQVLTISGNEFAYVDEKFDITKKVMTKLGIKMPEQNKK
ncbi:OmpH family outer membrane protein [Pseudotenacibaculum sp. MALMAid0570]|uniref:OmpH family outer membrane protein n=1 Tax=Pseudotenacibaculum sp. MALMAid0570 TaxID=3143938 RepID=UPI0032DFBEA1